MSDYLEYFKYTRLAVFLHMLQDVTGNIKKTMTNYGGGGEELENILHYILSYGGRD